MSVQVTASKTPLVLECARALDPAVDRERTEPTEPMLYGSALHELLEIEGVRKDAVEIAKKWGVDHKELYPHAVRTVAHLNKWLQGGNPMGIEFTVVGRETHRATKFSRNKMLTWVTRPCDFDADTHTYDLKPGEFGGTDDLVAEGLDGGGKTYRVVIDYKSGDWGDFHKPSEMAQMLTLMMQTNADAVAILHSPREGVPVMYCDPVSPAELLVFAKKLRNAIRRIGDGSLRPNKLCPRCPALEGCPAQDGALLKKAGAMIKAAVGSESLISGPVDKGAFHIFLTELSRLEKRSREILRSDVRNGEIIVRPDGKVLVLKKVEKENLSKASVVRALGKQKGEKMLTALRKNGAIEKIEYEELRAVDG